MVLHVYFQTEQLAPAPSSMHAKNHVKSIPALPEVHMLLHLHAVAWCYIRMLLHGVTGACCYSCYIRMLLHGAPGSHWQTPSCHLIPFIDKVLRSSSPYPSTKLEPLPIHWQSLAYLLISSAYKLELSYLLPRVRKLFKCLGGVAQRHGVMGASMPVCTRAKISKPTTSNRVQPSSESDHKNPFLAELAPPSPHARPWPSSLQ
eukprot:1162016-Pelagomonas_calceolata.AAC.18